MWALSEKTAPQKLAFTDLILGCNWFGAPRKVDYFEIKKRPEKSGGSGGARTRDKSNNDGPATGQPSQIASQESGRSVGPHAVEEAERLRLYELWPKLSPKLRQAVLSLVDVFENVEANQ
jgi:hypothetical protein